MLVVCRSHADGQRAEQALAIIPSSCMMATITSAISKDHRELVQYYKNILNAPDSDTALRWQNQFIWALTRHLAAEVLIVYPAFGKFLGGDGRIFVDDDQYEAQAVSPHAYCC